MLYIKQDIEEAAGDNAAIKRCIDKRINQLDEIDARVNEFAYRDYDYEYADECDAILNCTQQERWILNDLSESVEAGLDVASYEFDEDSEIYFEIDDLLIDSLDSDELLTKKVKKLLNKLI